MTKKEIKFNIPLKILSWAVTKMVRKAIYKEYRHSFRSNRYDDSFTSLFLKKKRKFWQRMKDTITGG